jgi:2-iminoacetate synthase ThiH
VNRPQIPHDAYKAAGIIQAEHLSANSQYKTRSLQDSEAQKPMPIYSVVPPRYNQPNHNSSQNQNHNTNTQSQHESLAHTVRTIWIVVPPLPVIIMPGI